MKPGHATQGQICEPNREEQPRQYKTLNMEAEERELGYARRAIIRGEELKDIKQNIYMYKEGNRQEVCTRVNIMVDLAYARHQLKIGAHEQEVTRRIEQGRYWHERAPRDVDSFSEGYAQRIVEQAKQLEGIRTLEKSSSELEQDRNEPEIEIEHGYGQEQNPGNEMEM